MEDFYNGSLPILTTDQESIMLNSVTTEHSKIT